MSCFEWDENKNRANQKKHHVSFEVATLIFDDPDIISILDERFDYAEDRWISIGLALGRVELVVAHTVMENEDGEEIIRIISARKATAAEKEKYLCGVN